MTLTRRQFGSAAIGGVVASWLAPPAFAAAAPALSSAMQAIREYGARHLVHFNLPGMTLGLSMPGGLSTVINFGFADRAGRRPITPDTLFEIGSVTKVMTAALVHQLAGEGRLRLNDRVDTLLPRASLPSGSAITVQHLLDHVSGIASDVPLDVPGGLWTGFDPGTHWHYSNSGYELLGRLAEHVSGEPLAALFEKRIFAPLGMSRSRGAILAADGARYAQGYRAANPSVPFALGMPLVPAPWVDSTSGAMCVGSTAADMMRLLRSLSDATRGHGGLGLSPAAGAAFASHAVPSDSGGMSYGNGLMHFAYAGRSYLHHTGGMVSSSSSFHLEVGSGAAAFACASISAFAEYRPRLLTLFAAEALSAAMAGRPLPPPLAVGVSLANPASYVGTYAGSGRTFEVRPGAALQIHANGRSAPLEPWGGELFRTTHPDFDDFSLMFQRSGPAVTGASWGSDTFTRTGQTPAVAPSDPALRALVGTYVNDSPWWGTLRVAERGGRLWLGTETPMARIADDLWRVGAEDWSPERVRFADAKGGVPETLVYSGVRFRRSG